MTDLRKAAEMALEALENFCEYGAIQQPIEKRDALRQALAQPEPFKPDWVSYRQGVADGAAQPEQEKGQFVGGIPEVSQQREWVGLTDKELQQVVYDMGSIGDMSHDEFDIARAVMAKLKELNT